MRRSLLLVLGLVLAACGVKAPPRPPVREAPAGATPAPASTPPPPAGPSKSP